MSTSPDLASAIEEVEWHWLRPHLERGALISVAPVLDLAEVADRIAADDTAAVGGWMAAGLLGRPTPEQIAAAEAAPLSRFRMAIVRPYVLIQEPSSPQESDHV